MKTACAVIGASFGDEGKGLVTDYLSHQGGNVVVRFNGGANAGHTVVSPDGRRHVFSHFGSGTFNELPTYLSEFFVCNPILFFKERDKLDGILDFIPQVYAHPSCLVTTFADMMINQTLESKRGDGRHGSCGVGLSETVSRSELPHLKITMADLWNDSRTLEARLQEICTKYAEFRTGKPIGSPSQVEQMIGRFLQGCHEFAHQVEPLGIEQCTDPIFEGAQGLLLDQDNKEFFPHLTRSSTGMKNVRTLCSQAGIDKVEAYYVSRTYLTRHGAGPLPGQDDNLRYVDDTNEDNEHQGSLRFAKMDYNALKRRCTQDHGNNLYHLVLTHCDQEKPSAIASLYSHGNTREHITTD
jgi:adenylosuccinate synthase